MSKFVGNVVGFVREVGSAIDAGHAVRLGLPVSENAKARCAPKHSRW